MRMKRQIFASRPRYAYLEIITALRWLFTGWTAGARMWNRDCEVVNSFSARSGLQA